MVIDFHAHVFPDRIAQKTIGYLSEKGSIPPFSDGTADGLIRDMEKNGIDISVNLPVLTSPKQFEGTNRYALELNSFFSDKKGALYPLREFIPTARILRGK